MTEFESSNLEGRVLIVAPTGKDGPLCQEVLSQARVNNVILSGIPHLTQELDRGASAVLLTEEVIADDQFQNLGDWLSRQPAWSDLPVLILSRPGADSAVIMDAVRLLGNVTVLERPIRVAALVSAVRTALRARQRQYQLRSQLYDIECSQESLRQRISEMTTLLDTLPVGVFVAHDPDCLRITGNRAASELLRTEGDANLSKTAPRGEGPTHFRVYQNGAELAPRDLPVQRAARGETVRNELIDQVFEDGRVIRTFISATPIFSQNGQLQGAIATILDVTQQLAAETALQEANRRKDEFLAMLAHELRNPLAAIRSAVNLLSRTESGSLELGKACEILDRQTRHLVRQVDDLLDVSRISRGKIELRRESCDLARIINHAIEANRPHCENMEHELTVTLPEFPVTVFGDPIRLAQVVTNLLGNACKFTDRRGRIGLSLEPVGEFAVIRVWDNGMGIAVDDRTRIFEIFAQAHRSMERSHDGLGLGLPLVKNIIEMHGGTVECRSDGPGRGSEFELRLPLHAIGKVEDSKSPVEAAPGEAMSRRILVVDDNHDSARAMSMLLRVMGHDVDVAHDGFEAVSRAKTFRADIIMMDIGMPGMNGYETARRIRAQEQQRCPLLVAVTGWGQEQDRRQAREAGFDAHLVKPVDFDDLTRLLADAGASGAMQDRV